MPGEDKEFPQGLAAGLLEIKGREGKERKPRIGTELTTRQASAPPTAGDVPHSQESDTKRSSR